MISGFGYAAMLNNRDKKRLIFLRRLLWAGLCFVWLPVSLSTADGIDAVGAGSVRLQNEAAVLRPHNFMVAENNRNTEDKNGSDSAPGEDPQQKPATDSESKPSKQKNKTDSLKSFEPTEKVKADQAVDFPYDI